MIGQTYWTPANTFDSPLMPAFGCSDFCLTVKEGTVVCGRTMDSPITMESELKIYNREDLHTSKSPGGGRGHIWVSKLGFVAINAPGITDVVEGMNEAGVSFSFLTLSGSQYPDCTNKSIYQCLAITDLGKWILSSFKTVEDVKLALLNEASRNQICIWGNPSKNTGQIPQLHAAVHDKTGKSIVIEFINGEICCQDNPLGVLTNEPRYAEQLLLCEQDRQTFASSSPEVHAEVLGHRISRIPDITSMNLPTGWSSTARFRRAAILVSRFENIIEMNALTCATTILNSVEIPPGELTVQHNEQNFMITTQWYTLKDLTNKIFHFRGSDKVLKLIDLNGVNFSKNAIHPDFRIHPEIPTALNITDHTNILKASTSSTLNQPIPNYPQTTAYAPVLTTPSPKPLSDMG